jgi:hypothetical protein
MLSTGIFGCSGFVFLLIGITFLALFFNQVPSVAKPSDNVPTVDGDTPASGASDWMAPDAPATTPKPLLDVAMDVPTYIW